MPTNKIPGAPVGIFKCRDLVTLYFGVRMVAFSKTSVFTPSAIPYVILPQDPRRISYEIFVDTTNVASAPLTLLGTPAQIDQGTAVDVTNATEQGAPISRSFFTELDAVTEAQMVSDATGEIIFSVREIILTPPGVDEQLLNPFTGAPPR